MVAKLFYSFMTEWSPMLYHFTFFQLWQTKQPPINFLDWHQELLVRFPELFEHDEIYYSRKVLISRKIIAQRIYYTFLNNKVLRWYFLNFCLCKWTVIKREEKSFYGSYSYHSSGWRLLLLRWWIREKSLGIVDDKCVIVIFLGKIIQLILLPCAPWDRSHQDWKTDIRQPGY